MDDLKARLGVRGAKCNLQFTRAEREYYETECGFTDEEIDVFRMRSRGYSVVKIMHEMESKHNKYFSQSTIEARIRSIKTKILKVL